MLKQFIYNYMCQYSCLFNGTDSNVRVIGKYGGNAVYLAEDVD